MTIPPLEAFAAMESGYCPLHGVPFMMTTPEETDEEGRVFVAIACSHYRCKITGWFYPYTTPRMFSIAMQHYRAVGGSRA